MSTITHPQESPESPQAFAVRALLKLAAGSALALFVAGVLAPRLFDVHADVPVALALILWAATPAVLFLIGHEVLDEWRGRKARAPGRGG